MKSKMLIFIVMLAAGAMMLTACGEESKESKLQGRFKVR